MSKQPKWSTGRSTSGWGWSKREDSFIEANLVRSHKWIAKQLGRSVANVRTRISILGLGRRNWTTEEHSLFLKYVSEGRTWEWIAAQLGRGKANSYKRRAVSLGIPIAVACECFVCETLFKPGTSKKCCDKCYASYKKAFSTVGSHRRAILSSTNPDHKHYKGMPFHDAWNPYKGGSTASGAKWVVLNLGNPPENASLHVIVHGEGFIPGNLEWASHQKQNNQKMFLIIAQLKHRVKELEAEVSFLKKVA